MRLLTLSAEPDQGVCKVYISQPTLAILPVEALEEASQTAWMPSQTTGSATYVRDELGFNWWRCGSGMSSVASGDGSLHRRKRVGAFRSSLDREARNVPATTTRTRPCS